MPVPPFLLISESDLEKVYDGPENDLRNGNVPSPYRDWVV